MFVGMTCYQNIIPARRLSPFSMSVLSGQVVFITVQQGGDKAQGNSLGAV